MSFKLTILGCSSAIPKIHRFTTSQALQCKSKTYLIDAGEGVQIRLNQFKIKRSRIHQVFISHLHGDHFFGLPGFITSLNLSGRTDKLTIYGPEGIRAFLEMLINIGSMHLNFELEIIEILVEIKTKIFEDDELEVYAFPLKHRITTHGFLFQEKRKLRNIDSSRIPEFKLTIEEIKQLKREQNVHRKDGTILNFEDFTLEPQPLSSYAYCSDTIFDPELPPILQGVTMMYHEATYLHDLAAKARERGHSTAKEAAVIAKESDASHLILGHFSTRYDEIESFRIEALEVFDQVDVAEDGKVFEF